jgi:predicted transcriptional regulator
MRSEGMSVQDIAERLELSARAISGYLRA